MKNIPEGYKKEKNRIIPLDWNFVKIGDILSKVGKRVEVKKDNNYRQIGIRSHGKGLFYKEPVTGEELGNKSVFWIEKDCFIVNIVFAWEQAIGKTTDKEIGMICSHRFPMYRPIENKIDIDYLVYVFKTAYGKKILELASPGGAGRNKTLGQKEFANSEILIPNSIEEQRRIVKIISTWDFAIEKQQQLLEKKKEFNKGLMQRFLRGEVRYKGFNEIWKTVKLKDIAEIYQPKTITSTELKDDGFPVYGANGVIGYYDEYNHQTKQIAITCRGSNCGNVNLTKEKSWITGNSMVVNVDNNEYVDKMFLYYCCKNTHFSKIISGSGQPQITRGPLANYAINIPEDLNEQKKIAEVLKTADKEIELLQKELEALKLQKKGLMQRLLTGEVRVKVD